MEHWRIIKDPGDDRYEVSDQGRVRSWMGPKGRRKKPLILTQRPNHSNYPRVTLWDGNKRIQRTVHRLVLEAFVGLRPVNQECRHLNGDPQDNLLENLAWGTRRENIQDIQVHRGIEPEDVDAAIRMYLRGVPSSSSRRGPGSCARHDRRLGAAAGGRVELSD